MVTLQQDLRRAVRTLTSLHDVGFDITILVEIAMTDRTPLNTAPDERRMVRDFYLEQMSKKPKSAARLRGERAAKAFLAEKRRCAETKVL